MEAQLATRDLHWGDAAPDNLGRDTDGNLKIIDGRIWTTKPEQKALTVAKIPSLTETATRLRPSHADSHQPLVEAERSPPEGQTPPRAFREAGSTQKVEEARLHRSKRIGGSEPDTMRRRAPSRTENMVLAEVDRKPAHDIRSASGRKIDPERWTPSRPAITKHWAVMLIPP
jgi:hypothetical protein